MSLEPWGHDDFQKNLNWDLIKNRHLANWKKGGMDALAKVMPKGSNRSKVGGWVTNIKSVLGRTPIDMERDLGFAENSKLKDGADIYEVTELPTTGQFKVHGYTHWPGGIPTDHSSYEHNDDYPPGRGVVQFCIEDGVLLRARQLAVVLPGVPFRFPVRTLTYPGE